MPHVDTLIREIHDLSIDIISLDHHGFDIPEVEALDASILNSAAESLRSIYDRINNARLKAK